MDRNALFFSLSLSTNYDKYARRIFFLMNLYKSMISSHIHEHTDIKRKKKVVSNTNPEFLLTNVYPGITTTIQLLLSSVVIGN